MKLVIGLGNPTKEYARTRHNLGFICLDAWAEKHDKSWTNEPEFAFIQVRGAILLKPNTWMNRSGLALAAALKRWKISDILVISDDLELPIATLRIRSGGGDGGHNGLKSLFTVKLPDELKRIRIGIGRGIDSAAHDHVLSELTEAEMEALMPVFELVPKFTDTYIRHDFNQVLNEYSTWKKSYSVAKGNGIISPKEENNDQGL